MLGKLWGSDHYPTQNDFKEIAGFNTEKADWSLFRALAIVHKNVNMNYLYFKNKTRNKSREGSEKKLEYGEKIDIIELRQYVEECATWRSGHRGSSL